MLENIMVPSAITMLGFYEEYFKGVSSKFLSMDSEKTVFKSECQDHWPRWPFT